MNLASDWNGRLLTEALKEQPALVLSFYSFGVMLQKRDGDHVSEYPVDPAQIALALAAKVHFDTGLLTETTLLIRHEGVKKVVVAYRAPQKTGLYLEGSEAVLRIPMPGLVLLRVTTEEKHPQYQLFAVKKRPVALDEVLYHAPVPNVFNTGAICWGSVKRVSDDALSGISLAEDWRTLLGSSFGDHGVHGKSQAFASDVRQQWIALEARKARVYPKSDLVPAQRTLAQVVGKAR